MTFYTTVIGANGRPRKVGITLRLVECIADLPHYQPPAPREYELPQERPGHNLTKALVRRALGKTVSARLDGRAVGLRFEHGPSRRARLDQAPMHEYSCGSCEGLSMVPPEAARQWKHGRR
jgi:hypothetical protein